MFGEVGWGGGPETMNHDNLTESVIPGSIRNPGVHRRIPPE